MAARNGVGSSRGLACARLVVGRRHPGFGEAVPFWGRDRGLGVGQGQQPSVGYSQPSAGLLTAIQGLLTAIQGLLTALRRLGRQQHGGRFSLHGHVPAAGARVPGRCCGLASGPRA